MASIIKSTTTDGIQIIPDSTGAFAIQTNGANTALTIDTSQNITTNGNIRLNNGTADGAQVIFASSGYSDWNIDNYSGRLRAYYNTTEYFTIDTSGNVGIGTSSPAVLLDITGTNAVAKITRSTKNFYLNPNYANGNSYATFESDLSLAFNVNASERMRIDSSGNVFVGTTSGGSYTVRLSLSNNSGTTVWSVGPNVSSPTNFYIAATGSTGVYLNGTAATSWTSASDENLKENLEPIVDALDKISTLRTVIGNFITDEDKTKKPFLIAQDVEKVLPEAVSINKTDDGNEYLGLSYTDTIPLLVSAIKELSAKVDAQQEEINALKGIKL